MSLAVQSWNRRLFWALSCYNDLSTSFMQQVSSYFWTASVCLSFSPTASLFPKFQWTCIHQDLTWFSLKQKFHKNAIIELCFHFYYFLKSYPLICFAVIPGFILNFVQFCLKQKLMQWYGGCLSVCAVIKDWWVMSSSFPFLEHKSLAE